MNFDENTLNNPLLVEPGVKYFLGANLKECRVFKNKFNNILINVALFVCFVGFFSAILFYKYKGKLTDEEMNQKNIEKQAYILSKIQNYQERKRKESQELITGLPNWENEYDILYKNKNKII
jgi:hypothetical protein